MIRRLRRRHLVVGVTLLALGPVALGVAARARPHEPVNPNVGATPPTVARPVPGLPLEIRTDSGSIAFRPTGPLRVPDPLLYWAPSTPRNASIPAGAVLIGSLGEDRTRPARALLTAFGPGGYLLIGHSESLNGFQHGLQYIKPAVYRKALAR